MSTYRRPLHSVHLAKKTLPRWPPLQIVLRHSPIPPTITGHPMLYLTSSFIHGRSMTGLHRNPIIRKVISAYVSACCANQQVRLSTAHLARLAQAACRLHLGIGPEPTFWEDAQSECCVQERLVQQDYLDLPLERLVLFPSEYTRDFG